MLIKTKPIGRNIPVLLLLLVCLIMAPGFAASALATGTAGGVGGDGQSEIMVQGKIIAIMAEEKVIDPMSRRPVLSQKLKVRLTSGKHQGKELTIIHNETDNPAFNIRVGLGDRVIVLLVLGPDGIQEAHIADLVRVNYLYVLGMVFVVLLLAIGWKKGAKALCSLFLTLTLICGVLLPGLLKGYSPVLLTAVIALAATVITMLVVGGFTIKSLAAILGTLGGVVIAGSLALGIGKAAHLTGFGTEEAAMLLYLPENIKLDIQGILFSGIIIGALGACMDVGMSIAAAVDEVKRLNPGLSGGKLICSGMNVGRDIMATQANTLILAYTGGSIQLILVFMAFKESLLKVLNLDMVVSEIVRAFAGSIGMITVIPITALVSGLLFGGLGQAKPAETAIEEADYWASWDRKG
ncbi:MAG TPA: YibE/F family protein [Bacillota bacterium]